MKAYDINFAALKSGKHRFCFQINQTFFDLFKLERDFENPRLSIVLVLEKKETVLQFNFSVNGSITLCCDLTNETFDYSLNDNFDRIVKFGEVYLDQADPLIIVPYNTHTLNIAQWIYEQVILSLPMKRIHPDVISGKADTTLLDKFCGGNFYQAKSIEKKQNIDPRWNKLKKLLNN